MSPNVEGRDHVDQGASPSTFHATQSIEGKFDTGTNAAPVQLDRNQISTVRQMFTVQPNGTVTSHCNGVSPKVRSRLKEYMDPSRLLTDLQQGTDRSTSDRAAQKPSRSDVMIVDCGPGTIDSVIVRWTGSADEGQT